MDTEILLSNENTPRTHQLMKYTTFYVIPRCIETNTYWISIFWIFRVDINFQKENYWHNIYTLISIQAFPGIFHKSLNVYNKLYSVYILYILTEYISKLLSVKPIVYIQVYICTFDGNNFVLVNKIFIYILSTFIIW